MTALAQRKATAYHEAGHAVAAHHCGVRVRTTTIEAQGDTSGQVEHTNPIHGIRIDFDKSDRTRLRVERLIIVCLAGPSAQTKFHSLSWRHWHGHSDHEKATDLAMSMCGSPEQADAFIKWLEMRATDLVELHWREIEAVAMALIAKSKISGSLIHKIIFETIRAHA